MKGDAEKARLELRDALFFGPIAPLANKYALMDAVQHWRENEAALDPFDVRMGPEHCQLCFIYLRRHCTGCPVYRWTQERYCEGSPYHNIEPALDRWKLVEGVIREMSERPPTNHPLKHPWLALWRAREAFKAAARDEIRFLESLREEDNEA